MYFNYLSKSLFFNLSFSSLRHSSIPNDYDDCYSSKTELEGDKFGRLLIGTIGIDQLLLAKDFIERFCSF